MLDWLLYQIPWWVYAIIGLMIAAAIQRLFGWRNALIALAGIAAAVFLNRAGQEGYRARQRQEQRERDALQEHYDEIENDGRTPDAAYQRLRDRAES